MRVVIIGGAGYIGTMLCDTLLKSEFLSKDLQLVVFDNLHFDQWVEVKEVLTDPKITFYNEDILDWSDNLRVEMADADYIIPLAAIVGAPACDKVPDLAQRLNYEWYQKLLPLLNGKQRIIYPNTNSGYGTTAIGTICTEDTPTNPISLYGKTKKQTEDLLFERYKNFVVFRLATVFGLSFRTRLDLLVNNFVYDAVKTGKIDIFDGHFCRNFVSVKDVSRAILFAILNWEEMSGNVYNLGTDELNCTKLEFAKTVQEVVPCEIKEHSNQTDPDQRNYMVSNEKLHSIGFYSLDTTLYKEIKKLKKFCSYIRDTREMFK